MTWRENYGQIQRLGNGTHTWLLPHYFVTNNKDCVTSPWFYSAGEEWQLVMVPTYGEAVYEGGGNVGLFLWKKLSHLSYEYSVSVGIKTISGDNAASSDGETKSEFGFGTWCLVGIKQLPSDITLNGLVKFFCTIERIKNQPNKDLPADVGEIKPEEDKSNEPKAEGVDRLLQNLDNLLLDGQSSDVVLRVENREFHVHKGILGVRSPVFASLYQLEMKENTGMVDIPDCTAESFKVFLQYIYTGSAKTMSSDNVFNLYYAADKYHVNDLKEECIQFMRENMSVENICDVIILSLTHSEIGLLKDAIYFFCQNVNKIIETTKWQKFSKENSTYAHELLIKAL